MIKAIIIILILTILGCLFFSHFQIIKSESIKSDNSSPEFMRNGEWKNIIFDGYKGEK